MRQAAGSRQTEADGDGLPVVVSRSRGLNAKLFRYLDFWQHPQTMPPKTL